MSARRLAPRRGHRYAVTRPPWTPSGGRDLLGRRVRPLRELLGWIGIDAAIPASLAALSREAAGRWDDGPHAITEMRNSLVHLNRRQRLTGTPAHARIDLQELVMWYVELALLRLMDYDGGYMNRLGVKMKGVTDEVPWA